jgi:rod shape-determining protein MreD
MREAIFLLACAVPLIVLQVSCLGFVVPPLYKPDVLLVLVVWSGMRLPMTYALPFAFALGLVVDQFSGSPPGLFGTLYSLIGMVCRFAESGFRVDTRSGRCTLVFFAMMFCAVGVFMSRWIYGPLEVGTAVAGWMAAKIVLTTVVSLVVFPVLDKVRWNYLRLVGERS